MSMFGLIWKSPERIARSLYGAVNKVTKSILDANFLNLDQESNAYARYYISSWILTNYLCENMVILRIIELLGEDRRGTALHVANLLENAHLNYLAKEWNPTFRVSDLVVWNEETKDFPRLLGPHAMTREFINDVQARRVSTVCLPVVNIVSDLYVVRRWRFVTNMTDGAKGVLTFPNNFWRLHMPVCRTLVMQITGDSEKATAETVMPFVTNLSGVAMIIEESVRQALA